MKEENKSKFYCCFRFKCKRCPKQKECEKQNKNK